MNSLTDIPCLWGKNKTCFRRLRSCAPCIFRIKNCFFAETAAAHPIANISRESLSNRSRKKRPLEKTDEEKLTALGEDGATLANVLERGLKTVSLTSHLALSTAFANDKEPLATFAQQVYVLGDEGDALLCLSTSGNSQNCVYAALTAKAKGIKTLAITGAKESRLSALCDVCIQAPETETYKVQELHLPIYHCLCAMLEEEIF